jgi:hypothetical protein
VRVPSELRRDPGLRRRLGEQGRDAMRRLFGLDACADALESLLPRALETGDPSEHKASAGHSDDRPMLPSRPAGGAL